MRKIFVFLFAVIFVVSCEKAAEGTAALASSNGTGGSLARFTIIGNYLYLADNNSLITYSISNGSSPRETSRISVGFGIETIYPYKNNLFIGSRDGMFIYSVASPDKPILSGSARHVRSCDPVVANDSIAFVTLKGGNACGPAQDGLYIYNIKNIASPVQIHLMPLAKSTGLGLKDTTLFVAREDNGLEVINVKNPLLPVKKLTIKDGIYYDVIALNNLLVCMVKTGILLYDISDVNNIKLVNTIAN